MKAGVVHAQRDIRYEEIETPVPKAGEVLIKVKYTGICGSDVPRVNGTACHYCLPILAAFLHTARHAPANPAPVKKGVVLLAAPAAADAAFFTIRFC